MRNVPFLTLILTVGRLALAQDRNAPRFNPDRLPYQWEDGQSGYNNCNLDSFSSNQTSLCQTAWVNSAEDFCIWGPPNANSIVGNEERVMVAWCTRGTHGTRVIPDGTLTGVHFVKTPDYIQVTGVGDLTKINIAAGDAGGELDPHGADGKGNPIGGLVYTTAFGNPMGEQAVEWTNFVSSSIFCMKVCLKGRTKQQCEHIYDVMGCYWNMPARYDAGFETCQGDNAQLPGVYGTSTWYQGIEPTPPAHPAPASSQCTALASIRNGLPVALNVASVTAASFSASFTGPAASSPAPSSAMLVATPPSPTLAPTFAASHSPITEGINHDQGAAVMFQAPLNGIMLLLLLCSLCYSI